MELTEEQIEKVALDFVKKPGMHGYIEVGDLIDFARALLAAHSAEVQEPAAWINYPCKIENGEFVGYREPELTFKRQAYGYDISKAEPLYRFTQPMQQTDAARDAKLHQPFARPSYEALTSIPLEADWSDARERLAYAGRVADAVARSCEIQLQQRLAEIERLDRAKGE